jgi:sugar phosphate isomerase/epimerase
MNSETMGEWPVGLVSVTFRQLTPREIVSLAYKNRLGLIEWGGDLHVPHGNTQVAKEVSGITRDAGLEVQAYGSYYKLGAEEQTGLPFEPVLKTAAALGAPVIRVWAGVIGSDAADEETWRKVTDDARRTANLAKREGIRIALEFHGGTLNDTPDAAIRLWKELDDPDILSLWQPLQTLGRGDQDASLGIILPRLSHFHVFQWIPSEPVIRRPLDEGREEWSYWIKKIRSSGRSFPALLEFLPDDDPAKLQAEAITLQSLFKQ